MTYEDDNVVEPIDELRRQLVFDRLHHQLARLGRDRPARHVAEVLGANVAGGNDDRVRKADGVAHAVGQAPVIEHLEEDRQELGVCFLELVEQHDRVRGLAEVFGQLPAVF
jgi:hypothetical protein